MLIDTTDQRIRDSVDRVLQIVKTSIGAPVIEAYEHKYSSKLYMATIRHKLELAKASLPPQVALESLHDKQSLLDTLDLNNWLHLILESRGLFEPMLKGTGIGHIKNLKDMRNRWAHHQNISPQEAYQLAKATQDVLTDFGCQDSAVEVSQITDELLTMIRGVTDETPTLPAREVETPTRPVWMADDEFTQPMRPITDTVLQIEIIESQGAVRAEVLSFDQERVIIGRGTKAHIVLNDTQVSRVHLLLTQAAEGNVTVTDLCSANGTMLEDEPLLPNRPTAWPLGNMITLGNTWLILRRG